MNLKVFRIRKDAKLPERAHSTDAGMDLFYCPNSDKKLYDGTKSYYLPPASSRIIPTGLKVEVPFGYMLEIKNKSGIASKKQLLVGACVVDCGYDGEVFVNLHNTGHITQVIEPGDKIAQAVLIPVSYCMIEEVDEDTLNKSSLRGVGSFGSTGIR
jgi:dUTP pyrophosphatase